MNSAPVAIIGPLDSRPLAPWLDPSDLVARPLPFQQGGAFLTTLLRARLQRGMPTLVINSNANATEPIMRWSGPLLRLWIVRRRSRGALRDAYRSEVRLLREALREARAPVTHAHWTYEYARAALGPDLPPAVVTVHDHALNILKLTGPRYLPNYLMSGSACRRAQLLTAPSPFIADYVSKKFRREVRVIPNMMGEDLTNLAAPRKSNNGPITVVTLANDAPFKNVRGALAAFARWRTNGPHAILRIIGPGLQSDSPTATWARSNNLAANVEFIGPLTHRDALNALSESDILLHPSLEESFGIPVMEAMALGIPVVAASEAGGSRFLLDDGNCGRLPSGRAPHEMCDALAATITQTAETTAFTAAAKKRIHTLCDPDRILADYESCYDNLLARP